MFSVHYSKEQSETIFKLMAEGIFRTSIMTHDRLTEFCVPLGKVKHRIDSVYAFEDVLKAYEKVTSGRAVGKVVVEVPAAQQETSSTD